MALLFLVMLVTAAGNTAMQSVMPSIGTALNVADVWISLAYTWSALLWVVCAPYWARRSDHRGRKAMMAIGLVGFVLSMGLCGMALWFGLNGFLSAIATLLLFALARSLYGGFGSAAPPAVQAYVASRTPRSERTQAMALIASSFGLGTVIGPALAPLLIFPSTGLVGPFLAFAAIGVVVLIALRLRLPDDTPSYAARGDIVAAPFSAGSSPRLEDEGDDTTQQDVPLDSPDQPPKREIVHLRWRDPRLRPWVWAGLLGGHAQAAMLGIIGFFILDRLGLRASPDAAAGTVGLVLMYGATATLLAQWGLIPMLKLGPRGSTMWGVAIAALGVMTFSIAHDLHSIALGFAIASMGFGLYRPGFTAGASLAVTRAEQGQVGGIVASITGATYILAPTGGVWLYGHHPVIGFATICALLLSVFILAWKNMGSDAELTQDRK
ncbi:MFS transporter [Erythrobacteraceae bacterium E2-1 Yellow Sea]|nr:MFS transporter [Erythrobacteraceae bacterium E2-1 Yellow Sea]